MGACPTCDRLTAEWKGAAATLRQMRRSAIVWDDAPQSWVVEERRDAWAAHRSAVHPDAQLGGEPTEIGDRRAAARSAAVARLLPRAAGPRVLLAVAVGGIVLLLVLVHSI